MIARRAALLLPLLILAFLLAASTARAQEETPTPTATAVPTITPTPSYLQAVPLSTGSELVIRKEVTYGDIAVVIAVLALTAITITGNMVKIPRGWFR
jgi:hypothetical protein